MSPGGCRLGLAECCWCHLLITSMYEQCERSRLQPGFDLFAALSGEKHCQSVLSITLHLTFTGRPPFRGFESHPAETFSTDRFSALTRTSTTPIHFHLTPRQRAVISLSSRLTESRCCPHCPACLPNQPMFRLHPGSETVRQVLIHLVSLDLKYMNREHRRKYTSQQVTSGLLSQFT